MNSSKNVGFGLFLVLLGVIFLLKNFNLMPPLPDYFFTWPMILVVIGVFNIFSGHFRTAFLVGGTGVLFIISDIYNFHLKDLWPLILIIIGISVLFKNQAARERKKRISDNYLDDSNVMGGSHKLITSQSLKGVKVNNVMGSSTLDFTECVPEAGAVFEINIFMGSCEMIIPNDWNIDPGISPVLGAFEDKRRRVDRPNAPTIVIKGSIIFGSVEVRS